MPRVRVVIDPGLSAALEAALGSRVARATPVAGGDVNEAYSVTLASGLRLFVKTRRGAAPALFPAEARGLDWLRAAGVVRLPRVLGVSGETAEAPPFLALEWLEAAPPHPGFEEALGHALAALHRHGAPTFGLDHQNYIGPLPQDNRPCATWEEFLRERRLRPQIDRAAQGGRLPEGLRRALDRLLSALAARLGPEEPPARLHGDLWFGNLHRDASGAPVRVDPAAYGGHREMDLAMMRLFGGFSSRVFAAYEEAFPLAPGHAERVDLLQLYPLLVHLNLFGASYLGAVDRITRRYV